MPQVKAIIFDCFGLFYEDPVFAYMRNSQSPPDKAEALHNLDEQAARGKLSKIGFITQASELLGSSLQQIEQQFFHPESVNGSLLDYAHSLHEHYKLALLSNIGADMMDGYFTEQEMSELFDVAVLSGSTGYAKPDPEIYELTRNRLGVEPREAVMVDDVIGNCDGARAVGMQAIHYQSFEQMKAELGKIVGQSSTGQYDKPH